ncbi:MAG: acetyl-CoA carboxylase biotin carboxyl carrier protein [Verrucomicrobia bacterium]|nr:acetyl-CoA carboxylase biotin carboxyl carrier protein [Verrucomicrobiota bacterium]MDA1203551.1 acetyl-CoA carboxylase biotin carboxyl carrier protein [Verrucomicrobiota bacterium]
MTRYAPEIILFASQTKKEINVDLKEIKALIDLMQKNGLTAFEMEKDGFRISLAKETAFAPAVGYAPAPQFAASAAASPSAATPEVKPVVLGKEIISPMVGTFYTSASPESPTLVAVGSKVTPDTVVCIIEAMKVMNEIKAEVSGTITEVAAENGQPVQFGQALFRYK